MAYRLHAKYFAVLSFLLVAACGGGGGGGSGYSSPSSTPPADTGPKLAQATPLPDGTVIGTARWPDGATSTGGTGQVVDGLGCGLNGSAYHVQTHLSIFLNGQQLTVPAKVGYVNATSTAATCQYAIHTDDASGKIQVEAATKSLFTLGQFFDLWGQPLSATNVAGITGATVTVYVNDGGTLTKYAGAPAQLELAAHREITIQIGSALTTIPTYTWADTPPLAATAIPIVYGQSIGAPHWSDGNTPTGGQGAPVQGIPCTNITPTYHVHTHVSFFLNGQQLAMPALVGILGPTATHPACDYELHTHDSSGKIHIEAMAAQTFTLGQFFGIWGMPLSATNVAGLTGAPIVVYINDGFHTYQYTGDLNSIELTSHRGITVQVGSPIPAIPTYSWDGL